MEDGQMMSSDSPYSEAQVKALARMSDGEAAFLVDCQADSRRMVYDRSGLTREFTDAERQSEAFVRYVRTYVSETDRGMMMRYADPACLLEQLRDRDEYHVTYQETRGGFPRFCEMRVMRYSDTAVVLCFSEKSREIVNRLILNRLEADYDVIFGVDLETGMLKVLKDRAICLLGEEGSECPYADGIRKITALYDREGQDFFANITDLSSLKRRLSKENKFSLVYRSPWGKEKWRSAMFMVLLRREDGTPSLCTLAFTHLDLEAGEKAALQQNLKKALDDAMGANRRNEVLHKLIKSASWSLPFDENRAILRHEFSPELCDVLRNDVRNVDEWMTLIHPDYADEAMRRSLEALHDPTGNTQFDVEYPIRSRDGTYHWIRSAGRIILNPAGGGELYGICVDIDESVRRRQNERRQQEEVQALERTNEAKSRFFSMVSHDIRTPLNAIIGYAELLKLGIGDEQEKAKAINSVLVSGHSLLELINDVLDLSKLEAGKMEITPEPADAIQLTQDIADAFRAAVLGKSIEIRSDVQPMPWLRFDPHRVRQILFNLVGNAVKFTDRGFVEIRANYVREQSAENVKWGKLLFEVQDTGCGMSEEEQQSLAEPYTQFGTSASRRKGTGLGLAICTQLVARMNGEIELESAPGKGTTFRVILPAIEEEEDTRRKRLSATQRIQYAVKSGQTRQFNRVLVVDDQAMNRMVLKNMLTRFGVKEIEMAVNGVEALQKLTAQPVDLVLTDMWMPEMDGSDLVREIRRNSAWAELPVYAITADVEAQKDYANMGFSGILLKPVTLEKLKVLFSQ